MTRQFKITLLIYSLVALALLGVHGLRAFENYRLQKAIDEYNVDALPPVEIDYTIK
jgi:hypothetical protein